MHCKKCQTEHFLLDDYENGCTVCTNCGLIASECLLVEEAVFDKSTEHMSHSMTNHLESQFQLPTAKMAHQSNVSFFSTQDPHTLKLIHFNKRFRQIFDACQLHESIETESKFLYLDFEKKNSMKGRNMEIMICAFIYIVCQKQNYAMNIKLFGDDYTTEIMKCVRFIEERTQVIKIVEEPPKVFHDNQIEAFIRKYSRIVGINRKMTQDIVKMIPKAEFIMRKKEIIAIALIAYYKKNKSFVKTLSKEFCISELAIKAALRDLIAS